MFLTHGALPWGILDESLTTTADNEQNEAYEIKKEKFLKSFYRGEDPCYEITTDIGDLNGLQDGELETERNRIIREQRFYKQFAMLLGISNTTNIETGFLKLMMDMGIHEHSLQVVPVNFIEKIVGNPSIFLGDIATPEQQIQAKNNLYNLKRALEEIFFLLKIKDGLDAQNRKYILKQLMIQLGQCLPGVQSTCTMLLADLRMPTLQEQIDLFKLTVLSDFHLQCIAERTKGGHQQALDQNSIHLLNSIISHAARIGFVVQNHSIATFEDMFITALPISTPEKEQLREYISIHYTLENLVEKRVKAFKDSLKQKCRELNKEIGEDCSMAYVDFEHIKEIIIDMLKRYGFLVPGSSDIPSELIQQTNSFYDELTTYEQRTINGERPNSIEQNIIYIRGTKNKYAIFMIAETRYNVQITQTSPQQIVEEIAKKIMSIEFVNLERAFILNIASVEACSLHLPPAAQQPSVEVLPYAPHKCAIAFKLDGVTYDIALCSSETRRAAIPLLDSGTFLIFLAHQLSKGNISLLSDFITYGREKVDEWAWEALYPIIIEKLRGDTQVLALQTLIAHQVSFYMINARRYKYIDEFLKYYVRQGFPDFTQTIANLLLGNDRPLQAQIYILASNTPEALNLFIKEYVTKILKPLHHKQLPDVVEALLTSSTGLSSYPEYLKETFMYLLVNMYRNRAIRVNLNLLKKYAAHPLSQGMFNSEIILEMHRLDEFTTILFIEALITRRDTLPFMQRDDAVEILKSIQPESKTLLYYAINIARNKSQDAIIPALAILALLATKKLSIRNSNYPEARHRVLQNPIDLALDVARYDLASAIYTHAQDSGHEFHTFLTNFKDNVDSSLRHFLRHDNAEAVDFIYRIQCVTPQQLAVAAIEENKTQLCLDVQLLTHLEIAEARRTTFAPGFANHTGSQQQRRTPRDGVPNTGHERPYVKRHHRG